MIFGEEFKTSGHNRKHYYDVHMTCRAEQNIRKKLISFIYKKLVVNDLEVVLYVSVYKVKDAMWIN